MGHKALKTPLLIFFYLLLLVKVEAQLNNQIFEQNDSLIPRDTQTVRLHFESFNYLRNTEYFDIIETGQTYFGALMQLHLSYQPYKNVLIKGGLQTKHDFGSNNIQAIAPVFSVSIFKHHWRHNFGMLQATTNLQLIEPMFNIDRAITNRIENGIQSVYKNKGDYFTNWLVWVTPTYRGASNQEQFNTGFVWDKQIIETKKWRIAFPLQGTLAHRGGQINTGSTPIYSRLNATTGLKVKYTFNKQFSIRTEHYWLHSSDFSPSITQPYKNGFASWHTLAIKRNNVELMFNYWAGREWQSPIGAQLFNNYNFYNVYEHRRVRHMAFTRLFFTQNIYPNLKLDLRFEPFYDFEYKALQYSYSVYLKLNISRNIGKI
ncbi:MAG: hypothetical protein PSX81_09575 [bacterium]|nr:hypothetical protein [bacterium]